jgi:hypothetical protein
MFSFIAKFLGFLIVSIQVLVFGSNFIVGEFNLVYGFPDFVRDDS